MKEKVEEWIKYADLDYKSALKLSEEENLTTIAAFHCQQAVEKYLKAMIENQDKPVPKIHNLEVLMNMVISENKIEYDKDELDQINDVYIDTRYPSSTGLIPEGIPKKETILAFISFVEKIKDYAMEFLK